MEDPKKEKKNTDKQKVIIIYLSPQDLIKLGNQLNVHHSFIRSTLKPRRLP